MAKAKTQEQQVAIAPPKFQTAEFDIVGTAPFVQLKFAEKAKAAIAAKMQQGSQAKSKRTREPRDFEDDYEAAFHRPINGGYGHPAAAFRNAMIDACRIVGFKMTHAKLAVFIVADDIDKDEGVPLVKIEGEPVQTKMAVRNETGVVDLRVRPMWKQWSAKLRVRFDADMFSLDDITNLLWRAGEQCGVGEGRHNSKKSFGMGWGTFRIKEPGE